MKTISQYREDMKSLMDKIEAVRVKCTAENRDPLPEEISYIKDLQGDVLELSSIVSTLEDQEKIRASFEKPQTPQTVEKKRSALSIQIADKQKFGSLGEQLVAVMKAGMPGGQCDPRLFNAAPSGLNETVPSDGGFLVQTDFSAELLEDVFATGLLASQVGRRIPISGNANGTKINGVDETSRASSRYGGVIAYWSSEAEEKTKSKPKFRKIELTLHKLIGLCYATDENLDDAPQLEKIIRSAFVGEFGFQVDDAMINGNGAGQPLGVLNAGCLVTVSKEAGQAAATILAENVIKMYSRLFASSYRNAAWYINQNTLPQLLTMSVAVGTGGVPVYLPPGNTLANAPGGALLGLPVYPIEQAASVGTVGDIILGDFQNGYVLAEKNGIQSDMSIHVRFIYDESVFRFVLRIDGQPVRASALTPYKGGSSYTQSHFIALETRS